MTESVTTDKQSPSGAFHTVGTGAPSADTRPVGDDDRAVIAVFGDLDGAQDAVERLAAAGFPVDRISIIGARTCRVKFVSTVWSPPATSPARRPPLEHG
jgi:Heat induced stress protein YflT domain